MPLVSVEAASAQLERELRGRHRTSARAERYQTVCILGAQVEYAERLRRVSHFVGPCSLPGVQAGQYGFYRAVEEDTDFCAQNGLVASGERTLATIGVAAIRAHRKFARIDLPNIPLVVPEIYRAELPEVFANARTVDEGLFLGGLVARTELPVLYDVVNASWQTY